MRRQSGSWKAVRCLLLGLLLSPPAIQAQAPNPQADPRAVVTTGDARFTILTPQLIRMEWAPSARFEDRASLVFINRNLDVPRFTAKRDGDWQVIETAALTLRYKAGSGRFNADNLQVTLKQPATTWRPGTPDTANLLGTTRTLDGAKGAVPLEPGLLSRAGWVVIDDSQRPLFDKTPWPWVMPRDTSDAHQDLYFFGYGHDYRAALKDFTRVAGKIPMPPRFAFGAWWSRYWAYTDQEFKQLVRDFDRNDVPLDVLVVDMDWHNTFELRWEGQPKDQAGQPLGWTGYTWDPAYFPAPENFLAWVKQQGLRRTVNLHPASGIQPHEAQYPAMARAMGIDPSTKQYVPFEIEEKKFANAYFANVIHPLMKQGVDFFWLDWQQWGKTSIAGLTPTWWLNYTFFTDMQRLQQARPIIFHRWGGLGNHRYQIGFSGDTYSIWDALAFEPYFTATAANVGYAYWSHDIGGHLMGDIAPELYTRWVQFGIFSPILRTHTTKNANAERRIWAYPAEYAAAMRDAFNLRYQLVPYIYTAARNTYDSGVAMLRPLYYDYPEAAEAYAFKNEYLFGDAMLVNPVVAPMSPDTQLATVRTWLPPGEWIEWSTGARLHGPGVVARSFSLDEIPLWVKAGAIVPMQPRAHRIDDRLPDTLVLNLFPGANGSTRVYEDAGNSDAYQSGAYSWTTVKQQRDATGALHVTVAPPQGSFAGMPVSRTYQLRLSFTWPPASVTMNGKPLAWSYDGDNLTTIVTLPRGVAASQREVVVRFPKADDALLDGVPGTIRRMHESMQMLEALWPADWPSDAFVSLIQTGNRIGLNPGSAVRELQAFRANGPAAIAAIARMKGDSAVIRKTLSHLGVRQ